MACSARPPRSCSLVRRWGQSLLSSSSWPPADGHPPDCSACGHRDCRRLAELRLGTCILFLWDWSKRAREIGWIPCALAAMGVLDGLHAASLPGEPSSGYAASPLVGGVFFAIAAGADADAGCARVDDDHPGRHRAPRGRPGDQPASVVSPAPRGGEVSKTAFGGRRPRQSLVPGCGGALRSGVGTSPRWPASRAHGVPAPGAAGPLFGYLTCGTVWWAGHWLHLAADLVALVYRLFAVLEAQRTIADQRVSWRNSPTFGARGRTELEISNRELEAFSHRGARSSRTAARDQGLRSTASARRQSAGAEGTPASSSSPSRRRRPSGGQSPGVLSTGAR